MDDADLRGELLKGFYDLRNSNGGWVPISEMWGGTASRGQLASVCQQLAGADLIQWQPFTGAEAGPTIGKGLITGHGVDVVNGSRPATIEVRMKGAGGPAILPTIQDDAHSLLAAIDVATRGSDQPIILEELQSLPMTADRAAAAFRYLKSKALIEANFKIPSAARLSAAGHDRLAAQGHEESTAPKGTPMPDPSAPTAKSNKVFIVHGRDDGAKNEVSLFLHTIGLEPIILHTRPNGGRHLLTKFTEESNGADFAVVLMTPDDEGGLAGASDKRPRARQNVVFELGFFIGKLGSANVAALIKDDVERPSDFDGIAYIALDVAGTWKVLLGRELQHAKLPFDPAKVLTA